MEPKVLRGDEQKYDAGKPMWDLLPWSLVQEIVEVLTLGAEEHGAYSWQNTQDGVNRYFAALHRHLAAWKQGDKIDPEWGKHHLAHAACCLLFMWWIDTNSVDSDGVDNGTKP